MPVIDHHLNGRNNVPKWIWSDQNKMGWWFDRAQTGFCDCLHFPRYVSAFHNQGRVKDTRYKEEIQEYAQKYGASLLGPKGQALFEKIDVSNDKKISIEGIKFEFINLSFFFTWILFISEVMAYYEKATAKWNKAIFCLW